MAPENNNSTNNAVGVNGDAFRFNLAKWVMIFAFAATGFLGLAAIYVARDKAEPFTAVKDILSLLLPVLSTWAGTVLAFYFSRENFESAARSAASLVRQLTSEEKLKATLVREVMIPIAKAVTFTLEKSEDEVKLQADLIDGKFEKEKKERLPILDPQGLIKYIIHRSTIDRYIGLATKNGEDREALSLGGMIKISEYKEILTAGTKTVKATASLAEVKILMDNIQNCADVFVTEDGTANTPVTGWITNSMVREQATV